MTATLGITRAIVSKTQDPEDTFVYHIHGLRENGDSVLIAAVDDEYPRLTGRILTMLQRRGIEIEGIALPIDPAEPEISFVGVPFSKNSRLVTVT